MSSLAIARNSKGTKQSFGGQRVDRVVMLPELL
jgi:hypothetical protein